MNPIRPGCQADLRQATDLLNEIIAIGGTTAITNPVSQEEIGDWLMSDPETSVWHVAIDEKGELLGFQWIGPWHDVPPEACEIGTFVKTGLTGVGIGSALFEATKPLAKALGYEWISANIRADNFGGLAYYQSRGFEDFGRITDAELPDGTRVDKILKRYDLKV